MWLIPGLDDKGSLDLSARLLWTRQRSDSLTGHYAVNEYVSPYIGAYWEHEFDGKQRAMVNGVGIGSPSLKGDTGMSELGLTLKPAQTLPLSFDLGVQGYVGKREGVTGTLEAKWEF